MELRRKRCEENAPGGRGAGNAQVCLRESERERERDLGLFRVMVSTEVSPRAGGH